MKAFLLCAGKSTRFKPYSRRLSKISIPFLNTPIVSYPLKFLEDIKTSHLLINTHHQASKVKNTIQKLKPKIKNIQFKYEPHLLGGAGALRKHQGFFKDDHFVYLNGDSVFLHDHFFKSMMKKHQATSSLVTLLVTPPQTHHLNLIWVDSKKKIHHIGKKSSKNLRGYLFVGMAIVHPEFLNLIKKGDFNIISDVLPRCLDRCQIFINRNIQFFEVGSLFYYLQSTHQCLKILSNPKLNYKTSCLKKTLKRWLGSYQFLYDKKRGSKLFLGRKIKGIKNIQCKNFCIVGDGSLFPCPVTLDKVVVGPYQHLKENAEETLKI